MKWGRGHKWKDNFNYHFFWVIYFSMNGNEREREREGVRGREWDRETKRDIRDWETLYEREHVKFYNGNQDVNVLTQMWAKDQNLKVFY